MKFVPRYGDIHGRYVIKRGRSLIIRLSETKDTTKFVLVDAVGPSAAAAGIKVGDIVMLVSNNTIKIDGSSCVRARAEEKAAVEFIRDVTSDELAIQTENGLEFVPFDDPRAAVSLGGQDTPSAVAAE